VIQPKGRHWGIQRLSRSRPAWNERRRRTTAMNRAVTTLFSRAGVGNASE